ncbi:MAG: CPBP family intramembrane metalloprotease [Fidelibacterota bacterium]|nr:MAG: CPBP family intramembrane metalloprotease [Candidatus Neomarinimicrobiota bacterium]
MRFAFTATIGSMFFGGFLGAMIVLVLIKPDGVDLDLPRWAIILSEALILVPLIYIIMRRQLPLAATLRLQGVTPVTLRDAVFIGLGVSVLIDELDRLVALLFPLPENIARGMEFLTFTTPFEALLVVGGAVIVAPLVEEVVFRGFFQGQLEAGYRDVTKAVLFSALLFTVLHFNPWWSLQIYLLGMVLGFLAWRTGSIWPCFIVHAVNNSLALWFANVAEGSVSWYAPGGHVSPLWLLAAALITYLGFKSLIFQNPEPIFSDR